MSGLINQIGSLPGSDLYTSVERARSTNAIAIDRSMDASLSSCSGFCSRQPWRHSISIRVKQRSQEETTPTLPVVKCRCRRCVTRPRPSTAPNA
jgi:hypothetical protein